MPRKFSKTNHLYGNTWLKIHYFYCRSDRISRLEVTRSLLTFSNYFGTHTVRFMFDKTRPKRYTTIWLTNVNVTISIHVTASPGRILYLCNISTLEIRSSRYVGSFRIDSKICWVESDVFSSHISYQSFLFFIKRFDGGFFSFNTFRNARLPTK